MTYQEALELSVTTRRRFWSRIGTCHSHLLLGAINPEIAGGPSWPATRQAYQPVNVGGHLLLCTDGLSDPFDDGGALDVNGFQIEFFIEAPEIAFTESPQAVGSNWAFHLLYQMAQFSAENGGEEGPALDEMPFLTIEFPLSGVSPKCLNDRGSAGLLLNVPSPGVESHIPLPLSPARACALTFITPKETAYAIENDNGREHLADLLAKAGIHHRSRLDRPDLI